MRFPRATSIKLKGTFSQTLAYVNALAWPLCVFLTALIVSAFTILIYPHLPSYPTSDEWTYVLIYGTDLKSTLTWLFATHVDHRIPLQKALHLLLLTENGFDFRSLVALNIVIAVAGVCAVLDVARQFRGYSHIGDIIAPLILLDLAFGGFGWGFAFVFVFPTSAGLVFLALLGRGLARNSSGIIVAAFAVLLAAAASGLNGVVICSVSSAAAFIWFRVYKQKRLVQWLSATTFLIAAATLATWHPSGQSVWPFSAPLRQLADWAYQLEKSSFVLAFAGGWWHAILVGGLTAAAIVIAVLDVTNKTVSPERAIFYATLAAYLALGLSVVAGRGAASQWGPGLEMHYGYLVSPIPILAWILVSKHLRGSVALALSIVLIVAYGDAFLINFNWRLDYARKHATQVETVRAALRSTMPAAQVVDLYMPEFYFVNTPGTRSAVAVGIERLRATGSSLYHLQP